MYKVYSPEWNITIEDNFNSFENAYNWACANCGSQSCWDNIWEIQYYNPSSWTMII